MKEKIVLIVALICTVTILVFGVYLYQQKPKVAYVDPSILYSEYTGKAYYDSIYTHEMVLYKNELDSLSEELEYLAKTIQRGDTSAISQYKSLQSSLYEKNQYYQEKESNVREKYIATLLDQISEKVKRYGQTNGYDIILGADGSGSLMYADSSFDITQEVLKYINEN